MPLTISWIRNVMYTDFIHSKNCFLEMINTFYRSGFLKTVTGLLIKILKQKCKLKQWLSLLSLKRYNSYLCVICRADTSYADYLTVKKGELMFY